MTFYVIIDNIFEKILSFDNKNKKFLICFVLSSLIRIFALMKEKKKQQQQALPSAALTAGTVSSSTTVRRKTGCGRLCGNDSLKAKKHEDYL